MILENTEPVFSFIIPTYNRPRELSHCLNALTQLDCERSAFECIVVDDGSEVSPGSVIESFRGRISLRLLKQPHAGPAAARNTGAKEARGKFLVFIDDDCRPSSDLLTLLSAHFAEGLERMVGGRLVNLPADSVYAIATQLVRDLAYSFYNADKMNARFFVSAHMTVPAALFRSLGGFDPAFSISEDRDFCDRWLDKGYRMVYSPDVVVHHFQSLTFRGYWGLYISYGRGAFRYNRAHAFRNRSDSTLRLDFYVYIIRRMRSVLSGRPMRQSLSLAFLLVLWQMANALGFTLEAMRYLGAKIRKA